MAKKKLYKSKTNFTLRRLHQSGDFGNIYERDYTTVAKFPSNSGDQLSIYTGPSFKLTIGNNVNRPKHYKYGKWLANPQSCGTETNEIWTLGCLPEGNKTDAKIILKPNSRRISDFACYGSAYELIRASLTDIVAKFPAEIYVSNEKLSSTGIFTIDTNLQKTDLYKDTYRDLYIAQNPFNINILQLAMPDDSIVAPLRYLCESEYNYCVIDNKGDIVADGQAIKEWNDANAETGQVKHFWVNESAPDKKCLENGDILAAVYFNNLENESVLTIICAYYNGEILYLTDKPNYRLRPNVKYINNFFANLDDFEKVLLNQQTDYTAIFETYEETEALGWTMREKVYKWPTSDGDWNLSLSGIAYNNYTRELSELAIGYDILFTNAIWKDMVHESISNMDLTTISNGEEERIDTSKVKQMLNIVGRQFDEIKKYADNIKKVNSITYEQDGDTPDYFLSDNLELSGWEPKTILNEISNDITTDPMYGSRTMGYTASDANSEFMRRLQLNSKQILSEKGTKRCIEDLMALFGYHSTDWLRRYYGKLQNKHLRKAYMAIEYVYVADGYAFDENPETICNNVKLLNAMKDEAPNDLENVNHNPYQGLPVAEVTYDNKTRLVPWFNRDCEYDSKLYFQMKGGWGRNDGNPEKDNPVYDYTITKVHYIPTLEQLYSMLYYSIDKFGVYYVGSTQTYYRIKDINKYNSPEGWEIPTEEELTQIENIVDNNKGNNPHTGDYDNGNEYIEAFGELFRNSKFDNIRDEESQLRFNYGFNVIRQADSTKCLYFSDNTIADEDNAALRGENKIQPYNFFNGGMYDESASLSVINSKELHIVFDDAHRDFLEKDVLPYVKQIIPSTTIFSYSFEHLDGDDDKLYKARTHKIICDGKVCPIYGVN